MTVAMSGRMVSVVIPTYNRCDRLRVALDAVCAQDVDPLQIIVVDNNSRDSTAAFVKEYPDPRVEYTLCTRQGIYQALNHGFSKVKGAYLTWTSDDNWYHPGALREMRDVMESAGADFVYSDFIKWYESTDLCAVEMAGEPGVLDEGCRIGPCFLFRRRVYELLGGHSLRYRWASDYDFWLRVYRAGFRMLRMPTPRYTFSYHDSSASTTEALPVRAEAARVRLSHGSYSRVWGRRKNALRPEDSALDVRLLWTQGYRFDAASLGLQIFCRRFWSPTLWGLLARGVRRGF